MLWAGTTLHRRAWPSRRGDFYCWWSTGSRARDSVAQHTGSVTVACGLSRSAACAVFPDQGPHLYPTCWQGDPYSPGKSRAPLKEKVISNILSSGFSWDTQEILLAVLNSLKETILIHFVLETSAHQLKKNASHCFGEVWDRFFPRAFCKWTSSSRLKVLHCGHCNSRLSLVRFMRLSRQMRILGLSLYNS